MGFAGRLRETDKMEEEAGFEIDAVENFSNGYAFLK